MTKTVDAACEFLDSVKSVLRAKNQSYGDSAGSPIRIFSRADRAEAIRVRIDDKLSRIARGIDYQNEDTLLDLVGYLALLHAVNHADKRDAEEVVGGISVVDAD